MAVLYFLSQYYYTLGLLILLEVIALVVAIRNYHRHRRLRVFTYYILFSLVQLWFDFIYTNGGKTPLLAAIYVCISNAFMLFEFGVCIFFIVTQINSKGRRRTIYIDALLYIGFLAFILFRHYQWFFQASFFYFESLFLLLPCLLYIYDLFVSVPSRPLKDEPSFWIITGFLFLNACTIPLYILGGSRAHYFPQIMTVNFILYILLFLLLIRAYRCPPANASIHARPK